MHTHSTESKMEKKDLDQKLAEIMAELKDRMNNHPIWNNRLLKACELGHFSKDDYKILFEQYFIYSKNFTRYLCALMANMENDYHRSQLSENIWEEGGGEDQEGKKTLHEPPVETNGCSQNK